MRKCPNCGAEYNDNTWFCVNCGTMLDVQSNKATEQPSEDAEQEEEIVKEPEVIEETPVEESAEEIPVESVEEAEEKAEETAEEAVKEAEEEVSDEVLVEEVEEKAEEEVEAVVEEAKEEKLYEEQSDTEEEPAEEIAEAVEETAAEETAAEEQSETVEAAEETAVEEPTEEIIEKVEAEIVEPAPAVPRTPGMNAETQSDAKQNYSSYAGGSENTDYDIQTVEKPDTSYTTESYDYEDDLAARDKGSIGWAILGFFFPLIGFILFLVWHKSKPNSAKSAGAGALVSIIVNFVLAIIGFIILGIGASFMADTGVFDDSIASVISDLTMTL